MLLQKGTAAEPAVALLDTFVIRAFCAFEAAVTNAGARGNEDGRPLMSVTKAAIVYCCCCCSC